MPGVEINQMPGMGTPQLSSETPRLLVLHLENCWRPVLASLDDHVTCDDVAHLERIGPCRRVFLLTDPIVNNVLERNNRLERNSSLAGNVYRNYLREGRYGAW